MMTQIKKHTGFLFIALSILGAGCIEKERPIAPRSPSQIESYQVSLGDGYGTRSHFNLSTGEVVASHPKEAWDLAFAVNSDSGSPMLQTRLNTSRFMRVTALENTSLNDPFPESVDESLWGFDSPVGPQDGLIMAQVDFANGEICLLDMGYSSAAEIMGFMMVNIQSEGNQVTLEYKDEQGPIMSSTFTLDENREWTYFSLLSGQTVNLEPEPGTWHLMFSGYTEVFDYEGGPLPYLVTGVLSIPEGTQVYDAGTDQNWDDLFNSDWDSMEFTDHWNTIGYDWKTYSLELGEYSVDDAHLYCVRDAVGREFLFRFLDFYDSSGNPGTITLEIRER